MLFERQHEQLYFHKKISISMKTKTIKRKVKIKCKYEKKCCHNNYYKMVVYIIFLKIGCV